MKTVSFNKIRLLGLSLFLSISLLHAQTEKRSINKSFPITADGKVSIDNSYGNVKLNNWDKNEVVIEVEIKVKANSQERAIEALEDIEINFAVSESAIDVTTVLPEDKKSWWNSWSFFGSNQLDYSINYLVQMPKTVQLNIDNDYGNIYLDETDGATQLNCVYGHIEIGRLNHKQNNIELAYAPNSEIDYVNTARIEADYSGLNIAEAEEIDYDADYSKSTFGRIAVLNFEADYGSLSLNEVNTLIGEADYLTIKVGNLNTKLDLSMDYGSVKVEHVEASTKLLKINADYSGVKLGADPAWDFSYEIKTEYAGFKSDFPLDHKKKIIEGTERYYEGKHLNGTNQLNLNTEYGSIKLIQN